jgi:hypothetical protein
MNERMTAERDDLMEKIRVIYLNGGYERQLAETYWARIEKIEADAARAEVEAWH